MINEKELKSFVNWYNDLDESQQEFVLYHFTKMYREMENVLEAIFPGITKLK